MIRNTIVIAALLLTVTAAHAVSTIKPPPPWQTWIEMIKKPWNSGGAYPATQMVDDPSYDHD